MDWRIPEKLKKGVSYTQFSIILGSMNGNVKRPIHIWDRLVQKFDERHKAEQLKTRTSVPINTKCHCQNSSTLLFRFGRLIKITDARELRFRQCLHFQLFAQESQAVAAGFGVQTS